MRRIGIFYFSGTGMTGYVVDKLKLALEEQQTQVDIFDIAKTAPADLSPDGYDALGIAYPVHAFNAPKIVIDFVRGLPHVSAMDTFIISTAAEHSRLNFASSGLLSGILRKKGFAVFCDRTFIMPCNFIVKFGAGKVTELLDQVKDEMPQAARDIVNRTSMRQPAGFVANFAALAGRLEWLGLKCAKIFYATKECIMCGRCAENCPNHNISGVKRRVCLHCAVCMESCPHRDAPPAQTRVQFLRQCGLCMRCLYICPNRAIKVRRPYRFIAFDSWYENEELLQCARYISTTAPPQK